MSPLIGFKDRVGWKKNGRGDAGGGECEVAIWLTRPLKREVTIKLKGSFTSKAI